MGSLRIAFLNDYTLSQFLGGAQLTILQQLRYARQNCPDVACRLLNPTSPFALDDFDLFVLHTISSFPRNLIEQIVAHKPFVIFENDFGFCKHRDHLCNYHCHDPCSNYLYQQIYDAAQLAIFLSPTHLRKHEEKFQIPRSALCPPATDLHSFIVEVPWENRDPNSACFIGTVTMQKGTMNMARWARTHPDWTLDLYGKIYREQTLQLQLQPNVFMHGEVPRHDVPEILNRHRYLLHLPEVFETFGRVIVEAMSCGCELIVNENIGALEWDDPIQAAKDGAHIFWDLIGAMGIAPMTPEEKEE